MDMSFIIIASFAICYSFGLSLNTGGVVTTLHEASPLSLQCGVSIDVDPIRRLRRHVAGFAIQSVVGGCCLCGVGSIEPRPAPPIAPQRVAPVAAGTVLHHDEPALQLTGVADSTG